VAAFAALAELAKVNVVAHVTRTAFGGELYFTCRTFVTCRAVKFVMCAGERELRRLVMVELPNIPAVRCMTARTLFTQATLVTILLLMAAIAIGLGVFKLLREMALLARHGNMQADQRKVAEVVIETDVLMPIVGDVALLALRA